MERSSSIIPVTWTTIPIWNLPWLSFVPYWFCTTHLHYWKNQSFLHHLNNLASRRSEVSLMWLSNPVLIRCFEEDLLHSHSLAIVILPGASQRWILMRISKQTNKKAQAKNLTAWQEGISKLSSNCLSEGNLSLVLETLIYSQHKR